MQEVKEHIATKLVPQLRFKEFDGDWSSKQLKEITSYVDYRGRGPEKSEQGVFLVTAKNIRKGFIDYECSKEYVPTENRAIVMSKGLPEVGDILFTTEAPLGNVAQVDNSDIALAQRVIKFRGKKELLNDYLLHFMIGPVYQKLITRKANGTTVLGISGKELHKTKIQFPTLAEQQKIASFLSAVDEKIQQLTKKKELLEQYKKGVMQQLFSGQLRFKDENGNPYPDWEEKRLGEVGKIVSGLTYSPDDKNEEGVLVLRSSNVHSRKVTYTDNVFVNVEVGGFNPLEENDVLICVRNGSKRLIGKNALISGKAIGVAFGAFMTVYRSESNLFLFHYFDSVDYKKEVHKNLGATINSINGSDLKKFKIPFPSQPEQQKIATYLSGIDTKIEAVNTQITQTQTFKKGLLQQMFV